MENLKFATKCLKAAVILCCSTLFLFTSCREDEPTPPIKVEHVGEGLDYEGYAGIYILNEGTMGANTASVDYLDFATGKYLKNLYPQRNPDVAMELGDIATDMAIYGSKMYIVVNGSNKVEVVNPSNMKRIAKIDIPNCRYLLFDNGKVYVSSYVGAITIDPEAPKGAVYRIDTASLQVTGTVEVGYQPEEMATDGKKIYVANSGGYRTPNYDNTVSVIDIASFSEESKIPVAINLLRLKRDHYDQLWVSSRGNFGDVHSTLNILKRGSDNNFVLDKQLPIPCSNFDIQGDSLFYYSSEWNNATQSMETTFGIVNIKTHEKISDKFVQLPSDLTLQNPYGISIYGNTGDIFLTDAKDFTTSGALICFDSKGNFKWQKDTGIVPNKIIFLPKNLATEETTATE